MGRPRKDKTTQEVINTAGMTKNLNEIMSLVNDLKNAIVEEVRCISPIDASVLDINENNNPNEVVIRLSQKDKVLWNQKRYEILKRCADHVPKLLVHICDQYLIATAGQYYVVASISLPADKYTLSEFISIIRSLNKPTSETATLTIGNIFEFAIDKTTPKTNAVKSTVLTRAEAASTPLFEKTIK
jgi:hypothetical protein